MTRAQKILRWWKKRAFVDGFVSIFDFYGVDDRGLRHLPKRPLRNDLDAWGEDARKVGEEMTKVMGSHRMRR
jgi:hypothetical protein